MKGTIKLLRCAIIVGTCLAPVAASAQATGGIAGVVRDTTGAVLPGVTVEAMSPALIEKVRTVTTDDQGLYRVTDLRPGIYTVTFTLPGFSTVKREGVELSTGFTANVNAELRVGGVEETVTVTGASPIVDVQNTRTQTVLTREVIDTVPTGRSVQGFGALTLGAVTTSSNLKQDVGGLDGEASTQISVHGGRGTDMKLLMDGMGYNWSTGPGGGGAHRSIFPNQAAIQEVVMETTGATAEAETGGVQLNIVPKDGGNVLSGTFFTAYSGPGLQGSNLDQRLRDRGLLRERGGVKVLYDNGGGLGGPIKRDRLWFYTAHRKWGAESYVPGNYWNKIPHTLFYEQDLTRQAHTWQPSRDHSLRLTWQAAEKHKLTGSVQSARNCTCYNGIEQNNSPEATGNTWGDPWLFQSTWNYPVTNRVLIQAGATLGLNYRERERSIGVLTTDIPVRELSNGYTYGAQFTGATISLGDYGKSTFHQSNVRFSVSYVTGSHTFKTGFYNHNGSSVRDQVLQDPPVAYTFRNRNPVSVSFFASPHYDAERSRTIALYAQDQWTLKRLTLNLGVRYDHFHQWIPPQVRPGGPFVQEFRFDEIKNVPNWKDVSPRFGAAYDLFGNGKTAIKGSLGRYLESDGNNISSANNPALNIVTSATRTWNDANRDYIPQESELGPLSNSAFGTLNVRSRWDPELLKGFGLRNASWQGSLSVQHELRPGIGVMAGYFRTSYENIRVTDNLLWSPADFDPFCVTVPQDSRLPNAGSQICGLYDIKPTAFGQVNNRVKEASQFGKPTEVFQGVDVGISARFGQGGFLSGGVSRGQTVTDDCYVVDNPSLHHCRVTMPFEGQTQYKFNGAYPLPWKLQVSGVFQNLPGAPIQANYIATNAAVLPTLGRNLGQCGTRPVCTGTVAVNLIEPNTLFEDRLNQVDLRLTRMFRVGRVRIQPSVDLYNVFNANTVLASTARYGTQWLQPRLVLTPRLLKFGGQIDF